jgi:uncharacterized membrane protein YqjE
MNKLLSLLGLDVRIRRIRIAAGESAMAIEDRAQLVRMAWDEEKHRLKRMLVLAIAVLGLTTVAVALFSVAVVIHFWDTPHRATAAWSVAAVWVALWALCLVGLLANHTELRVPLGRRRASSCSRALHANASASPCCRQPTHSPPVRWNRHWMSLPRKQPHAFCAPIRWRPAWGRPS